MIDQFLVSDFAELQITTDGERSFKQIIQEIAMLDASDTVTRKAFFEDRPFLRKVEYVRDLIAFGYTQISRDLSQSKLHYIERSNLSSFIFDYLLSEQCLVTPVKKDRLAQVLEKEELKIDGLKDVLLFSLWLDVIKLFLLCDDGSKTDYIASDKYKKILDRYSAKMHALINDFYLSGKKLSDFYINNPWEFYLSFIQIDLYHCDRQFKSGNRLAAQEQLKIAERSLFLLKTNMKTILDYSLREDFQSILENYLRFCADLKTLLNLLTEEKPSLIKELHDNVLDVQVRVMINLHFIELLCGSSYSKTIDLKITQIIQCRRKVETIFAKLKEQGVNDTVIKDLFNEIGACFSLIDPDDDQNLPFILVSLSGLCSSLKQKITDHREMFLLKCEDENLINEIIKIFTCMENGLLKSSDDLLKFSEKRQLHYDSFLGQLLVCETKGSVYQDVLKKNPLVLQDVMSQRDIIYISLVYITNGNPNYDTCESRINHLYHTLKYLKNIKQIKGKTFDDKLEKYLEREFSNFNDITFLYLTVIWNDIVAGLLLYNNDSRWEKLMALSEEMYPEVSEQFIRFAKSKGIVKSPSISKMMTSKFSAYIRAFITIPLHKCHWQKNVLKEMSEARNTFLKQVLPRLIDIEKWVILFSDSGFPDLKQALQDSQDKVVQNAKIFKLTAEREYLAWFKNRGGSGKKVLKEESSLPPQPHKVKTKNKKKNAKIAIAAKEEQKDLLPSPQEIQYVSLEAEQKDSTPDPQEVQRLALEEDQNQKRRMRQLEIRTKLEAACRQKIEATLFPDGFERIEHLKLDIREDVKKVMRAIRESGFKVWLTGGAIRDLLMDKIPHDYDLITNCPVSKISEILAAYDLYKKRDLEKIGLDVFTIESLQIDIVHYLESPLQQVLKHDFTIHMLLTDEAGNIYNYGRAYEDLMNKKLVFIDDCNLTNPRTLMRLIGFSSRFDSEINERYLESMKCHLSKAMTMSFGSYKFCLSKLLMRKECIANFNFLLTHDLLGHLFCTDHETVSLYRPNQALYEFWLNILNNNRDIFTIIASMLIPQVEHYYSQEVSLSEAVKFTVEKFEGAFKSDRAILHLDKVYNLYLAYQEYCEQIQLQLIAFQENSAYTTQFDRVQTPPVSITAYNAQTAVPSKYSFPR